MRTIEAFQEHAISILRRMSQYPGMYGNRNGLELLFWHVINELCWIDGQEDTFRQLRDDLFHRIENTCGVSGALTLLIPGAKDELHDEIASIYSQLAHKLGYLTLDRILTSAEWKYLIEWFEQEPMTHDLRLSDVKKLFGEPSFHTCGSWHQVHSYAGPEISDGWICFDYANEFQVTTDTFGRTYPGLVYGQDYILRDCRRTIGTLREQIKFTPYGRKLSEPVPIIENSQGTSK